MVSDSKHTQVLLPAGLSHTDNKSQAVLWRRSIYWRPTGFVPAGRWSGARGRCRREKERHKTVAVSLSEAVLQYFYCCCYYCFFFFFFSFFSFDLICARGSIALSTHRPTSDERRSHS